MMVEEVLTKTLSVSEQFENSKAELFKKLEARGIEPRCIILFGSLVNGFPRSTENHPSDPSDADFLIIADDFKAGYEDIHDRDFGSQLKEASVYVFDTNRMKQNLEKLKEYLNNPPSEDNIPLGKTMAFYSALVLGQTLLGEIPPEIKQTVDEVTLAYHTFQKYVGLGLYRFPKKPAARPRLH